MAKEKQNIQELTVPEVEDRIREMKKELFTLRFRNAMRQLDNPLRIRFLRRDVARYVTALAEHQQGIRFLATGEDMPPAAPEAAKGKPKTAAKAKTEKTKPGKAAKTDTAFKTATKKTEAATSDEGAEKPKRRAPWSRGKKKE